MKNNRFIQVAVGVIKNSDGEVLISLRDKALQQGGLWEFPGGKLEAGETAREALCRELKEELSIVVNSAYPLITIKHQYPETMVQLNVFLVESFFGNVVNNLGQPTQWVEISELDKYRFLAANQSIICATKLPPYYAILDDTNDGELLSNFQKILSKGVKLIHARLKKSPEALLKVFIDQIYPICQQNRILLLINSDRASEVVVDGIHLTSRHLLTLQKRPESCRWLAASCHNLQELQQAERVGVDYVVLAPVFATQTHPHATTLGWQQFASLVEQVNLPVYALGGLSIKDLDQARFSGAQGIAAIRTFLD